MTTMEAAPKQSPYRVAVFSVVKHDYIARAVAVHPRLQLAMVTDEPEAPDWVHQRNQRFADEFEIPYERDPLRALDRRRVQVAVISSEAERHCRLGLRAVEAGLHVILDKPLSPSLSECRQICEAVRHQGVASLVWNRNYHPALLQARRLVETGRLGRLKSIHCDFYFAKDAGPPKGSRRAGDPPIDWLEHQRQAHADGSDGGVGVTPLGELQVEGIYPLAYIRMLSGRPVRRVFARTTSHFHQVHADHQVEDLASLSLELEENCFGSICLGRIGAASHPNLGEIKLRLVGSDGALVVGEPKPEVAFHYKGQPASAFPHQRVAHDNDRLLVEEFVRVLEQGGETSLDVHAAREIGAVVEAAMRSAGSGRVETVAL